MWKSHHHSRHVLVVKQETPEELEEQAITQGRLGDFLTGQQEGWPL